MMLNFAAYVFAFLAYYAVGFAFQFGACSRSTRRPRILGGTPTTESLPYRQRSVGLSGGQRLLPDRSSVRCQAVICLTLFEVVFMETAGYIIVGAICERITFWAFLLCELFIGALLYPSFRLLGLGRRMDFAAGIRPCTLGHGYVDFAGSTVVHGVGGFCAMALAVILGPRLGKYGPDGKPRAFPASQSCFCRDGHVRPAIWLDGFQSRFDPGRDRPADFGNRHEYQSGCRRGLSGGDGACGTSCLASRTSRWPVTACLPAWSRSPLLARLYRRQLAVVIGIVAGYCRVSSVFYSTNACLRSMILAARFRSTDTADGSARCAVGIFADGTYGAGWNGVGVASYLGQGRPRRHWIDPRRFLAVLDATRRSHVISCLFVHGHLRGFQGRQCLALDARLERSGAYGSRCAGVRNARVSRRRRGNADCGIAGSAARSLGIERERPKRL